MMNVFEKIKEKFANIHRVVMSDEDLEWNRAVYKCETLVNQVEQEHNNGWIACSERLPNETGYYMTYIYNSEVDDFDFRKTWFAHVDDYDMEESEWRELYDFETVTAWQPLPQPYKERDTNGN